MPDLDALCAALQIHCHRRELLERALTHRSYAHEHDTRHYERLEFLGDAVLSVVTAERLYAEAPDADEGDLTRRRASYVSEDALYARTAALLEPHIRVGAGLQKQGPIKKSVVADVAEAIIGAVYVDQGLAAARDLVARWLGDIPPDVAEPVHAKNELQERLQRVLGVSPTYHVARAGGPDHAPVFVARVSLGDAPLGEAEGPSQKVASTSAAARALEALAALDDEALVRQYQTP